MVQTAARVEGVRINAMTAAGLANTVSIERKLSSPGAPKITVEMRENLRSPLQNGMFVLLRQFLFATSFGRSHPFTC